MKIFDKIFKGKKEIFGKDEICFAVEMMEEPTIKQDGKYVRAGYFKANKTQFFDVSENRLYKCSIDANGVMTVNGKQMMMLENRGEVYSDNYDQYRFYRPLIKSKVDGFSWVESARVATGAYADDMWFMFPNGEGYRKYFCFLLDDEENMTIEEIRQTVKELNTTADHIITDKLANENTNCL